MTQQQKLENLKKYLKECGFNEDKIEMISTGKFDKSKKKKIERCIVTLEIEIDKDIAKKYPNFIFNYENEKDFLINQIASLNHNISLDECMVYLNLHPHFEDPEIEIFDDGYKQIVKNVIFQ